MSITNWEITDPVTNARRIVAIEITARDGSFDVDARFTDDRGTLIAGGSRAGPTEAEALEWAKRSVMAARSI